MSTGQAISGRLSFHVDRSPGEPWTSTEVRKWPADKVGLVGRMLAPFIFGWRVFIGMPSPEATVFREPIPNSPLLTCHSWPRYIQAVLAPVRHRAASMTALLLFQQRAVGDPNGFSDLASNREPGPPISHQRMLASEWRTWTRANT